MDPNLANKVYDYLRQGEMLQVGLLVRRCFVCGAKHEGLSNGFHIDGKYIWSINIATLFKYHDLELPIDFMKHMAYCNYKRKRVSRRRCLEGVGLIESQYAPAVNGKFDMDGYPLY